MNTWIQIFFLSGIVVVTGCTGETLDAADLTDTEISSSSDGGGVGRAQAAIITGCPSNAAPCDCALKGMDICKDQDGDGRISLNDNCPYAYNPGQANCDGDYKGDACDSENVTITRTTTPLPLNAVKTDQTQCLYDPSAPNGILFRKYNYTTGTQTIETKQYCGPSGYGRETRVVDTDTDSHSCWTIEWFSCARPQSGYDPTPACPFGGVSRTTPRVPPSPKIPPTPPINPKFPRDDLAL